MNHSCVANTRVCKRKNHVVCIRAQTPILKGEEIFLKYTSFFAGQIERSELIQDNWNFCCECARCIDPSDLGSNFDTMNCTKCKGTTLPKFNDLSAPWVCGKCGDSLAREKVRQIQDELSRKTADSAGDLKLLEVLLTENLKLFHTNHHQMVLIKVQIILEFGKLMEAQAKIGKSWSLKQVRRKVELCEQVLDVMNRIDPGLSETKSQIMHELSAPKLMLLQYNLGTGKQELKEIKNEMENLIVIIENVCNNHEVFEEGKEEDKVKDTKALLKDAKDFYKEAVMSRMP